LTLAPKTLEIKRLFLGVCMVEPPLESSPKPTSNVSSRIVDGEVVLLDHTNERIHQLNATASFIWSRLDGRKTIERVAAEMTQEFDVDEQKALADVGQIVAELVELELLE
jgi:hypothetical protein